MSEDNEREPILLPVPPEELDGPDTVWTGPEREPTELEKEWYRAVARRMRSVGMATGLGVMSAFWAMAYVILVYMSDSVVMIAMGIAAFLLGILLFRGIGRTSDFTASVAFLPIRGRYIIGRSGYVSLGGFRLIVPSRIGFCLRSGCSYTAEGFLVIGRSGEESFVPVRIDSWILSKSDKPPQPSWVSSAFFFMIWQFAWFLAFISNHGFEYFLTSWAILTGSLGLILIWRKIFSLLEPSPLLSRLELAPLSTLTQDSRTGEQVFGQELTRSLTSTEQTWLDHTSTGLGMRSRQIGWGLQGVAFAGFVLCLGLALSDHNGDLVGYGIGLLGLLSAVAHLIRRAGRVPADLPLVRLSGLAGVGLPWDRNCQTIGEFPLLWPEGTPPAFAKGTRAEVDAFLIEMPQAVWCAPITAGAWHLPESARSDLTSPSLGGLLALVLNAAWIPALSTLFQGIATWLGWELQALAWVPWALTGGWVIGLVWTGIWMWRDGAIQLKLAEGNSDV